MRSDAARRRALGDQGRPVPDRAAIGDVGHRRHDPDQRVRPAAGPRAVPVAGGGARRRSRPRRERVRSNRRWPDRIGKATAAPAAKPSKTDEAEDRASKKRRARAGARRRPKPPDRHPSRSGSATSDPADRRKAKRADRAARGARDRRGRGGASPGPRSSRACRRSRGSPSNAGSVPRPPARMTPSAAVGAAVKAMTAGEDEDLGVSWRLVDDRGRPIEKLDLDRLTQRPGTHERPAAWATGRGVGWADGYLADFSSVRRQRVQTSDFVGGALDVDDERLEVRLHAAVGSNAVHPRRLGVEAAHRYLAADRAGAGHAWSSGGSRWRSRSPEGPERSGRIAHGLPTPASGRMPDHSRQEDIARVPTQPTARSIARHPPGRLRSRADRDARVVRRDRLRRPAARAAARAARARPARGSPSTSATTLDIELDLTVAYGVPVAEVARQVDSADPLRAPPARSAARSAA